MEKKTCRIIIWPAQPLNVRRTKTTAVVTAVVLIAVPKMQQVKCSVHDVMYILLYTGTAVVQAGSD